MQALGTVSQILQQKGSVWTIAPDATVLDALRLMADKNIGAVMVTEGERVIGILSERDYARKVILKGKTSKDLQVRDIMSSSIVVVNPSQTIEECMRLMTGNRVRHLPVLDAGKLAGVISIGDVVNWVISAQSAKIGQLEDYIHGKIHS